MFITKQLFMNWKEQLKEYEQKKDWDFAINLLNQVINTNPFDLDAYLNIIYLLMNLLVEENYSEQAHDYYAGLLKKYFIESYSKFCHNPEYLFYIGIIAHMSEWYLGIEIEEAKTMIKEALRLDPDNILYKWGRYAYIDMDNIIDRYKGFPYAKKILLGDCTIRDKLRSKGLLGEYILEIMENWSKETLSIISKYQTKR